MRATISFDIDLTKVEETMGTLVAQESSTLRLAANILDNAGSATLLEEVTDAIDLLQGAATQLEQYKNMVVNFQRAKFQTMVPQDAPGILPTDESREVNSMKEVNEVLENMKSFESFLSQMPDDIDDEEVSIEGLEDDPEEG
jgi:hypothetical protein